MPLSLPLFSSLADVALRRLSTTLISRLILNLRDPQLQRGPSDRSDLEATGTVTTALVIGPLTSHMNYTNVTQTDTDTEMETADDSEAALRGAPLPPPPHPHPRGPAAV